MASPILIEACVDTVQSALAAEAGGADRIELCDNLAEGGTTPSAGMIEECVARLGIPVFVIIRPRGGDFLYTSSELAVMLRDIGHAKQLGVAGIVTGALDKDGGVAMTTMGDLLIAASPLPVTFHRAFDAVRNPDDALDQLIEIGIARVLTAGQAATALEGAPAIAATVERAAGRIGVIAGGGVNADNVAEIVRITGVREVHARGTVPVASAMEWRRPGLGLTRPVLENDILAVTDAGRIRQMRTRLE
ncbi:MAG TPA: copper homeostasis protein CutC [Gemmatimonadales bacterium]|jgi:copper homeostasis protein|nr:copper homeostasis protein CutC [Gemmatimonadales bacterium]